MNALASGVSALQSRIISARTLIAGQGAADDVRAVSDYYLGSGDKCGPQTITGEEGRKLVEILIQIFLV